MNTIMEGHCKIETLAVPNPWGVCGVTDYEVGGPGGPGHLLEQVKETLKEKPSTRNR